MKFVAIYQSAHPKAEEEAAAILDALREAGITAARVRGKDEPGASLRSCVVEVDRDFVYDAQALLQSQGVSFEGLDVASDLDFHVAFFSDRHDAENEALAVKALLEANGIAAFLAESNPIPTLPAKVLVPREEAARAREVIASARATGPADAEQAASETGPAE